MIPEMIHAFARAADGVACEVLPEAFRLTDFAGKVLVDDCDGVDSRDVSDD